MPRKSLSHPLRSAPQMTNSFSLAPYSLLPAPYPLSFPCHLPLPLPPMPKARNLPLYRCTAVNPFIFINFRLYSSSMYIRCTAVQRP
jgi:hypothetical protein